jgi:hypothetical protein
MPHRRSRRPLAWAVASTLLLPVVLSLVLGLGGLLSGLGDTVGAAVCHRLALVVAVLWAAAVVVTTVLNAVAILERPHRPRPHFRRRRRRRLGREVPVVGISPERPA